MKPLKPLCIVFCLLSLGIGKAQEKDAEIVEDDVPEKKTKAERAFEKIDLNADGVIEFEEFRAKKMNVNGKRSMHGTKSTRLSKKFSEIDANSNNKIEVVEFETALTPKKERAYILKKLEIFSKIDKNKDNKIDLHEFKRIKSIGRMTLSKKGKPNYKEKKFAEIDANDDGFINIEEFDIDKKLISKG